ncbi:type II toxin-antitoxin system PemK/MazF family toxin [Micromonospora chaiyaphumensis]|uniref:PemK-like, MazF-like toxin of type II toxin-antitoxin system n=1 Tax=Micromonospora chaiyaphumensis TaxID=307119 RepID=A0A1C4YZL6_9ACTN|nr:type II toxin-antitoxin system PemK/MazF family toxin [Micromonospora chaiyaphumensis]SCF26114.1 PemK-like, MazF-like toxin of type II toxin-antitoxin system [Micromonospora chaiyaphumensis]
MRDGLLWAAVIAACVAAGWLWGEWRHRAANRSAEAGQNAGRRNSRPGGRPDSTRPGAKPTRGRAGAPPRPRRAGKDSAEGPRPGEIWWADVPYADGTGSKVRPCLVLRVDGRDADVLKITSQDKSHRDDHLPIPTRSWDPDAHHDSYLDISEPVPVPLSAFADHAGACDPDLWRGIRRLPHLTA